MAALFKVQHLAPAETQRPDESEWVEGWAAAHNGRIQTQHQFGSEGIAGQSKGIDYGMSRRSISVPGDKRGLKCCICRCAIRSVLAVRLF